MYPTSLLNTRWDTEVKQLRCLLDWHHSPLDALHDERYGSAPNVTATGGRGGWGGGGRERRETVQKIVPDLPAPTTCSAGRIRTIQQKGRKEGESPEEKTSVAK